MKIQILSDIHFEHHKDGGEDWINSELSNLDCDVLVLAGDICEAYNLQLLAVLHKIMSKIKSEIQVIYVPGNHEFYHRSNMKNKKFPQKEFAIKAAYKQLQKTLNTISSTYSNFNGSSDPFIKKINNYNFVCATMWHGASYDKLIDWSDYYHIPGIAYWLQYKRSEELNFMKHNMDENSIMVSHFLPCHESISPRFAGSDSNVFYLSGDEELRNRIIQLNPKMWIHGHTHDVCDYFINKTRVVCNPIGYPKEMKPYVNKLLVEI